MDIKDCQHVESLAKMLKELQLLSPSDVARVLPLYIKLFNDNGPVRNISLAYIEDYDGKKIYRRFKRHFDQMYEMFLKNAVTVEDRQAVFRRVADRISKVPTTVKGMQHLVGVVAEETKNLKKKQRLVEARKTLVDRFSKAVKKYLHLTYSLGFNEPSACVKTLAERHTLDKYVMSGDFPVILLPFLPEVENTIRKCYEHYEMKDAWEVFSGRYFNHKDEYSTLAVEIKSSFNRSIPNFSDYFDRIYTDTYYKKMLEQQQQQRRD